ncbi:hypothetical protein G4B88_027060 [Cannabis sativa]|uniref:PUM-HD domain-containing protein n=1 Tax=Cannabis sativa TaxID=3483 RepID=A0A7J6HSK7_CANSA|nr:hypothetical protein G4B88_027060 [Cannabis sativa]
MASGDLSRAFNRTAIIRHLAGRIVRMSQQKFASNVVKKCLSFGAAEERQLLAMMKDPFGKYVVQKVFVMRSSLQLEKGG